MIRNPLQIYLDSSDFSTLSDPARLDEKTIAVKNKLQSYADRSLVQFRFSIVHVSEAAPLGPSAQQAAERRSKVMHQLCGSNSLVTTYEIQEAEIAQVPDFSPFSIGRWYPPIEDLLPKFIISDLKKTLHEELRSAGLNREQRRKKEVEIFRKTVCPKRHKFLLNTQ